MTDFLDRLIARSLSGSATIPPRLPALFEPAPDRRPSHDKVDEALTESHDDAEAYGTRPRHEFEADSPRKWILEEPAPPTSPRRDDQREVGRTGQEGPNTVQLDRHHQTANVQLPDEVIRHRRNSHRASPTPFPSEFDPAVVLEPQQMSEQQEPRPSAPPDRGESPQISSPIASSEFDTDADFNGRPGAHRPLPGHSREIVLAHDALRAVEPTSHRILSGLPWSKTTDHREFDESARDLKTESAPTVSPHVQPAIRPTIAGTEQQTRTAAGPHVLPSIASTPTIHVNIGRLEVRGSNPVPSAESTLSVAAVESLEDYLRQRATGRTR
jgi:hypothetical protein